MASARAFGLLNNQNLLNGNQHAGRSIPASKSGESRQTSAFALKDLTNRTQRTHVNQDGKGKSTGGKPLKVKTNSILQKISTDNTKPASRKRPKNGHPHSSPQHAEYAWGQANCLREDLLDQMLDLPDISYGMSRKPLKPARSDLFDLPDLTVPWGCSERADYGQPDFAKPLPLPADDFPLVDIQDLEFMF